MDTANGAPIVGVARAVNTDSLTPIPPGTPIAINPISQEVAVKKNISAMDTFAPNAEAVIEVDNDIKIHAGVCSVVYRNNTCHGANTIPLGRNFLERARTIL